MNDTTTSETGGKKYDGFSEEERAAMKERAQELKAEARREAKDAKAREKGEADLLEKIAEMSDGDRSLAERLHAVITAAAPELLPKTWYGMPAYARGSDIVCFFQPAQKFNTRYSTLGFNDPAALDDGTMWPTAYALTELTTENEATIAALVTKAVS